MNLGFSGAQQQQQQQQGLRTVITMPSLAVPQSAPAAQQREAAPASLKATAPAAVAEEEVATRLPAPGAVRRPRQVGRGLPVSPTTTGPAPTEPPPTGPRRSQRIQKQSKK